MVDHTNLLSIVSCTLQAKWFQRELSVAVSTISAKDILLDEASSSFDPGKILEQTNSQQSHSSHAFLDRVLIIDGLDAIISNADETDSSSVMTSLESEQLRALNAVVKLIDAAICDDSSRFFVLGISRASWAQSPPQLARVGRFEKVVTMPSPTLDQRRDIFKFWLSTLPLSEAISKESTIVQWADLLAPRTSGCVAADIRRICADALTSATARAPRASVMNGSCEFAVQWENVKEAARACIPSQLSSMDVIPASLRDNLDINGKPMDTKQEFELAWKSFGGYDAEKKRIFRTIVRPWKYHIMGTASISDNADDDARTVSIESTLGMSKPSGVLFHGPAGVGKTFAAMCLASSLGLHCVKVSASCVKGFMQKTLTFFYCNSDKSVRGIQSMAWWIGGDPSFNIYSSKSRIPLHSFLR